MTFADFLKWITGVDGGALAIIMWAVSWGLEEFEWWKALASKIKALIILGAAIVLGLLGVAAGNLPPEVRRALLFAAVLAARAPAGEPPSKKLDATGGIGFSQSVLEVSYAGKPARQIGKVTGLARVALTLEAAGALQPGEILVCPTTAPAWTPLFATAAAVVTDTGGILNHCAVVAREFGIPAVVGTQVGTATIRTGQRITVDGSTGTVTLES